MRRADARRRSALRRAHARRGQGRPSGSPRRRELRERPALTAGGNVRSGTGATRGSGLGSWDRTRNYARQAGEDSATYVLTGRQRKRERSKVSRAVHRARRGHPLSFGIQPQRQRGLSGNPALREVQVEDRYQRRVKSLRLAIDAMVFDGRWRW